MSDDEESYCRLCAEPTPTDQLISTSCPVGLNSKISKKLSWINIDVSASNTLPKTICFSCFDQLERCWLFLNNSREAQKKLLSIFNKKNSNGVTEAEIIPVNTDWDEFKKEVKIEFRKSVSFGNTVKIERMDTPDMDSSDSEPLLKLAEKKSRANRNFDEISCDLNPNDNISTALLDLTPFVMTWEDYTWCCSLCNAQCKTIDLLRLHSLEIHNTCSTFKCSDCHKTVPNYQNFISHVCQHYSSLKHSCDICNKPYKSSKLVKKHRNIHRESLENMCESCGAIFKNAEALSDHVVQYAKQSRKNKKIENELNLSCDICNRHFKSRSNLYAHKLVHTERSREFSCHICGKMFYTKGALSTHMTTHEEVKPFKCDYCPLSFRARGNLTAHISLHSEVKPFVCEQCGKSFRVRRHLKSHSIVHTDLMPYICEFCNKQFRFKTRLNLHLRQHTGAKPYKCDLCRREFTNGSNYKKHMKRRHNIDTSVRKKMYGLVDKVEVPVVDSQS